MSKRLFILRPWFWVGVGAFVLVMLAGYLYSMVVSGVQPVAIFDIDSKPTGASILWGDKELGITPYRLEFDGRLVGELKLSQKGYRNIIKQIDIEPGKTERIRFHLMKDTLLVVNSKPQGANLYIDGDLWGSTPCTLDGLLEPGSYEIRVEKFDNCYGEVTKTIELKSSEELVLISEEFELPRLNLLTINSQPLGVMIKSGEEEWGLTPLSKCLPAGMYDISFEKDGFVTETVTAFNLKTERSLYKKLYDPEAYKKKDHFEVDASQVASIIAIPCKAGDISPVYGKSVKMGNTPSGLSSDELMEKSGIASKPYSYIISATAKGFQCGISGMTDPGQIYFELKELSSSAKSSQGHYKNSSVTSYRASWENSPDSRFSISADKNVATLTELLSGETHSLYLESDYIRNEFIWSGDSRWLWYFRNNQGIRELIRLDTSNWEEEVIDSIDLSQILSAKGVIPDNILQCISSVGYSASKNRIYYLVPGSKKNNLTLVSNTPAGGNRTEIAQNLVPVVDDWSLWLEDSGVLKLTGFFPGLVKYEGYYLLDKEEPVHFEIVTNPNPEIKIGRIKQLSSGVTMFPSTSLIRKKGSSLIIGARLYKGLSIVFMYHPTSDEYELIDVMAK